MIDPTHSMDWNLGYIAFFAEDPFDDARAPDWQDGWKYAEALDNDEEEGWPDEA